MSIKEENDALWPFDNNVDTKKLTRAEQRERESKIEICMEAYPFLPFPIIESRLYRTNTSWVSLNMNGQEIVKLALQELDQLVVDYYANKNALLEFLPKGLRIPYQKVAFGFPSPLKADSLPRTFIEYRPLTSNGKPSKTPLMVHFTTIESYKDFLDNECHGELTYGIDGNVCHATAYIFKDNNCYIYEFGVIGRTFTITKITTVSSNTGKKVMIYNSNWDFILY